MRKIDFDLSELKTRYDNDSVSSIERNVKNGITKYQESRAIVIQTLWYLQKTNRFRENSKYEQSTFETYIKNEFNISPSQYRAERWALVAFPDASARFGVGTVTKIRSMCGSDKVRHVLDVLNAMKVPSMEAVNQVIHDHRKERIVRTHVCAQCEKWSQMYSALMLENSQLQKQIAKLKATVQKKAGMMAPKSHVGAAAQPMA